MSEIFEHIRKDLFSLYENNVIEKADQINAAIGSKAFCENMPPMYFVGNLNAKTVLVMLNPGAEDRSFNFKNGYKSNFANFDQYYSDYLDSMINYGNRDFERMDNFDLKQAAFLYHFNDSGIEIPENFWSSHELKKDAKRNVLQNKLQMELIPYHSRTFSGLFDSASRAQQNVHLVQNEIERLFNTIIETERQYVVFCSKQFYYIFNALSLLNSTKWDIINDVVHRKQIGKLTFSFNKGTFTYSNKTVHFGIAHSFASQALPNAIDKMAEYGKFCFDLYN